MDFKRRKDLEQIGADLESGKRISIFVLIDKFRHAFPDKSPEEVYAMAREAIAATNYIN
jgi:hypothetical protein